MLHVLVGAVVGAVVGGAASAIGSLVKGKPISWKKVAAGAVGGAVAGSVASLTFGAGLLAGSAATQFGGMVVAGATSGAAEQVTDNALHDQEWHRGVGKSAAVGAAVGAVGGVARVVAKPLAGALRSGGSKLSGAGRRLLGRLASRATAPARRAARRLLQPVVDAGRRRLGKLLNPVAQLARRRVLDPLGRAFAPVRQRLDPVLRPLGKVWNRYRQLLDKAPVRTKSATAATIAMTGDVIAQAAEGRECWDWRRTAFRGAFAALWSGPMGHYWFAGLDKVIPGNAWGSVLAKIATDQLVWAPVSGSVFFGTYSMIYDGMSPAEAFERTKRDLPRALKAQYTVWPAVHLVNFRAVPLNMRVPFSATVGLGWSVFFSGFLNDDEPPEPEPAEAATARRDHSDHSDHSEHGDHSEPRSVAGPHSAFSAMAEGYGLPGDDCHHGVVSGMGFTHAFGAQSHFAPQH